MTTHGTSRACIGTEDTGNFLAILAGLSEPIGIHEVVVDEWGTVVDASLAWWNGAYQDARLHDVGRGTSLLETYVEPHRALGHVAEAWETGRSVQAFHLGEETRSTYRHSGTELDIWISWERLGRHVVEVGCNADAMLAVRDAVMNQQSLVAVAARKRAIAVERERIARNLHDVVIQHLYATSLSLAMAGKRHGKQVEADFNAAIAALDRVISEIRCEILAVESQRATQLRLQLEDILMPVLNPTNVGFDLSIEVPTLPADVQGHVRAVCLEAVSNAVRHGHARNVVIRITRHAGNLVVDVIDDGDGIDPARRSGNGLHNMRQRAESLGGNMQIHHSDDRGTAIAWSIPYPRWS